MKNIKTKLAEIVRATILVIGIVLSILPNFFDLSSIISNPKVSFGIGLSFSFIAIIWYLIDLQAKLLWSKPEIIISSHVEEKYSNNIFYRKAKLRIFNNEELEITECFATLEYAADVYDVDKATMPIIPSLSFSSDRIKWIDTAYSNNRCEISIPPNDFREIDVADMLDDLRFNLCSKNVSTNWMIGAKIQILKIRIDGKFNGKAMKPIYFDGYIYSNTTLIFERGDWKRDKHIAPMKRTSSKH